MRDVPARLAERYIAVHNSEKVRYMYAECLQTNKTRKHIQRSTLLTYSLDAICFTNSLLALTAFCSQLCPTLDSKTASPIFLERTEVHPENKRTLFKTKKTVVLRKLQTRPSGCKHTSARTQQQLYCLAKLRSKVYYPLRSFLIRSQHDLPF